MRIVAAETAVFCLLLVSLALALCHFGSLSALAESGLGSAFLLVGAAWILILLNLFWLYCCAQDAGVQSEKTTAHAASESSPKQQADPQLLDRVRDISRYYELSLGVREAVHDLNNVLMIVSANLELCQDQVRSLDKPAQLTASAQEATAQAKTRTAELLALSRTHAELQQTNATEILGPLYSLADVVAGKACPVTLEVRSHETFHVDRELVQAYLLGQMLEVCEQTAGQVTCRLKAVVSPDSPDMLDMTLACRVGASGDVLFDLGKLSQHGMNIAEALANRSQVAVSTQGSTDVEYLLRLSIPMHPAIDSAVPAPASKSDAVQETRPLNKLRILLLSESDAFRELLRLQIDSLGHTSQPVPRSADLEQLLTSDPVPDMLLCDVDSQGRVAELVASLCQDGRCVIPVALISSHPAADSQALLECEQLIEIIAKPYKLEQLASLLTGVAAAG